MSELFNFKDKSFAVYGLGLTGKSVIKFLKKNKVKKTIIWDDHLFNLNIKLRKKFKDNLDLVDHIIISPGININNSILKKKLLKNKKKLLTDLDLFFFKNNLKRSIVITGTNGKSTTCSLIHHIFIKNKIKSQLAGNIGKPILDIKFIKNEIYIIEA
jgi:UDP-N-acetylmuramoylalanine--D-glutamate ligase